MVISPLNTREDENERTAGFGDGNRDSTDGARYYLGVRLRRIALEYRSWETIRIRVSEEDYVRRHLF